jgi:hypothetical protein
MSYFHSVNVSDAWVGPDFKDMVILPTHYSIRSGNGGPGWYHPKSWVIEIAATGDADWIEVDRRSDVAEVNQASAVNTFDIRKCPCVRFIRLRQVGKNHRNDDFLIFSGFELFGALGMPPPIGPRARGGLFARRADHPQRLRQIEDRRTRKATILERVFAAARDL